MGGNECHGRHILGLCNKILAGVAFLHVRRVQSASEDRFALCVGREVANYSYITGPMTLEIILISYSIPDLSIYRIRSEI